MTPEQEQQLRRFMELREQFERNVTLHPPKRPGFESFIEIARDLPVAELLAELERLRSVLTPAQAVAARLKGVIDCPVHVADHFFDKEGNEIDL